LNWTNEILESIDSLVIKEGYPYAAGILTQRLGKFINPEQLRGARRRWLARREREDNLPLQDILHDKFRNVVTYSNGYNEESITGVQEFVFNEDVVGGDNGNKNNIVHEPKYNVPPAIEPVKQDIVTINDPNILVLADPHCPMHNVQMIERALEIALKHFPHVRKLAIIGDLIDFSSISRWTQDSPSRTTAEQDVRVAGSLINELLRYFDDLYCCSGNHDERLTARLNSHYSLETILCGGVGNTNPKLHITDLDYIMVGDDTIIGHSNVYSRRAAFAPNKSAMLLKYNVAVGHSHRVGLVVADDGVHWAADIGHCCNPDNFYYVRRRINAFSNMAGGFMILDNGRPQMFGEAITNWQWWGVK